MYNSTICRNFVLTEEQDITAKYIILYCVMVMRCVLFVLTSASSDVLLTKTKRIII